MKSKKILALLIVLSMLLSVITACAKTDSTNSNNSNEQTAANESSNSVKSEYLVWNIGSEPKTWDPTMSSETLSEYLTINMFEGLTKQTEDGIEPGMAEKWDVSDDGKTYTFHIRKDVKWSDGTPLTAHDFEYTWKRMCDPAVASDSVSGMIDYVVGAEEFFRGNGKREDVKATALDDYTFEVVLKNPTPFFPQRVSADIYVPVNKKSIETGEGWEKRPNDMICNGPFKLSEYQIGSHILMVKNDLYYNADKVKLKGIKAIMVNDENTSLQGYKTGEIHVTEIIPAQEIPTLLTEDPNLKITPLTGTKYIEFNVDKDTTNDVRVRKALALAINRKLITEQITRAGEVPATGFLPPTVEKTTGESYRVMTNKGYPEQAYGISADKAEVEEAKKLLAEAGYADGKGFPELEFLYATSESDKKVAEAIQQMWKENLNIDVKLRNEEKSVFLQTKKEGKFSIGLAGWSAAYYDGSQMMKQFTSYSGSNNPQWRWKEYAGAPHDKTFNKGNKVFDDAFTTAMASIGTTRDDYWIKAEQALMDDMPACPLYYYVFKCLINEDYVHGVKVSRTGNWLFRDAEMVK